MAAATGSMNLQLQSLEDSMEISSDQGLFDQDLIDVEIEQDVQDTLYGDDDQMAEDTRSDRGMTDVVEQDDARTNDDEMADGSVDYNADIHDGFMHDEPLQERVQDEELLDFGDDEPLEEYVAHVKTETMNEQVDNPAPELQTVDDHGVDELGTTPVPLSFDEIIQPTDTAQTVITDEDAVGETLQTQAGVDLDEEQQRLEYDSQPTEEIVDEGQETKVEVTGDTTVVPDYPETVPLGHEPVVQAVTKSEDGSEDIHDPAQTRDDDSGHFNHSPGEHKSEKDDEEEQQRPHEETETAAGEYNDTNSNNDGRAGTPTVTGLHPTIVRYQDSEVTLFPSSDPTSEQEYLLENENLVNGSIGDMLEACRVVLGESITEDDELELSVDELGLYLSEDSTPAFSTSFSEILDIYVQLQAHDGITQPPPLYVTLSTKTRFTNRLTLLAHAAAEGTGLSRVPLAHESQHEDYEDHVDDGQIFAEYDSEEEPHPHEEEHTDQPGDTVGIHDENAGSTNDQGPGSPTHTALSNDGQEPREGSAVEVDPGHDQTAQDGHDDENPSNEGEDDECEDGLDPTSLAEEATGAQTTTIEKIDGQYLDIDTKNGPQVNAKGSQEQDEEDLYAGEDNVNQEDVASTTEATHEESKEYQSNHTLPIEVMSKEEDHSNPSSTEQDANHTVFDDDIPIPPEDDLDEIDFGDDPIKESVNNSGLKRSWTQHAGDDDLYDSEQDVKKARS